MASTKIQKYTLKVFNFFQHSSFPASNIKAPTKIKDTTSQSHPIN
jgi:hypothetical protein